MKYTAQFKSLDNKLYEVNIITNNSSAQTTELKLSGDAPVLISQQSDGLFSPIKSRGCTVKIVSNDYYFDMYTSVANGTSLEVNNLTDNINEFRGYLTPNVYNQEWKYLNTIELEAIEAVSTLQYYDYQSVTLAYKSFYNILKYALHDICGYDTMYVTNDIASGRLKTLSINEQNFFSDDGEWVTENSVTYYNGDIDKYYDVISEICKFLNVSLVIHNDEIYLLNYYYLKDNKSFCKYDFTDDTTADVTKNYSYSITADSYKSDGADIDLTASYNKITVECNTYEPDKKMIFPDFIDKSCINMSASGQKYNLKTIDDGKIFYIYNIPYKNNKFSVNVYGDGTMGQTVWRWSSIVNRYTYYPQRWASIIDGTFRNGDILTQPNTDKLDDYTQMGATPFRYFQYTDRDLIPASADWEESMIFGLGMPKEIKPYNSGDKSAIMTEITNYNTKYQTDGDKFPFYKYTSSIPVTIGSSTSATHIVLSGDIKYYYRWVFPVDLDNNWSAEHTHITGENKQWSYAGIHMSIKIGNTYIYPTQSWSSFEGHDYYIFNHGGGIQTSNTFHSFYIPCRANEKDLISNGWMQTKNTVEFTDNIDASGFDLIIPQGTVLQGNIEVAFYCPHIHYKMEYDVNVLEFARPRYAAVKGFSMQYVTPSAEWTNPDYTEEDVKYSNIPVEDYVEELDSISLKITTQVDGRATSISSVYDTTDFLKTLHSSSLNKTQLQEYNIIEQQHAHYNAPKKSLTISLPYHSDNNLSPIHEYNYALLDNTTDMFLDAYELDLKMNKLNAQLIEF